ncbi:hypothetical protein ABZX95_17130 [Streptomyces sp. NPDC004232]|uniref:hypothetical protein n=1 Tax=Streptomyces sp. NPDC004232 TaxID=3154454 RepID=UPI0033BA4B7A
MPSTLAVYDRYAPRSERRRVSRDLARRDARYGTPGHRTGPHALVSRPKPRPASTRSGQARVNYKRNQRAKFLEHLIALSVSVELAEICDVESCLAMLPGRIIRREKDLFSLTYIYRMYVPDAPDGAATMDPIFRRHDDGTVTVQSIEWLRADGSRITRERTDG